MSHREVASRVKISASTVWMMKVYLGLSMIQMLLLVGKRAVVPTMILLASSIPSLQVQGAFLAEGLASTKGTDCGAKGFVPFFPDDPQLRHSLASARLPHPHPPPVQPVSLQHRGRTKRV